MSANDQTKMVRLSFDATKLVLISVNIKNKQAGTAHLALC